MPLPGHALEPVEFLVMGADRALEKSLRATSIVLGSERAKSTDAQDLFADSRAEYANLLNTLYAFGHYSPVIHVLVDGKEAADVAPLEAPGRVDRIRITIDPGPRFTFSRAEVRPVPPETTLPRGFRVGKPAESGLIIGAVGAGVDAWRSRGHAKARVAAQDVVADHPNAQLSAVVALDAGPRLRFGRLTIQGQDRMREDRIRAITGLPEGEIFDPEKLERAKSRLRRTGVFQSVTLSEDEDITLPDLLGITAILLEQKRRRYTFGAEVASFEGLTLSGAWLHRNLFGGAERLRISGDITNIGAAGSGVDYVFGISLDRPATFTPDTTLGFGAEISRLNENDYNADGFSLSTTLTHVFSDQLSARAGLKYAYFAVTDQAGRATYRNLALPLGLTWDKRDSKTDANEGFYLDAELKPFLGFQTTESGVRFKLDIRAYKAFGDRKRFVLAGRLQAGAVIGASLAGTSRDDLFYSGGGGTVRGQPYQSLGVNVLRDGADTYDSGGKQFLAGSIEARFKTSDKIGLVGFVDVGRIDSDGFFAESGDWHAGAGLGLRYATGLGPIRVDLAGPIGGETGNGLQIYVGLGQAF